MAVLSHDYMVFTTVSQTYQSLLFGIVLWDWLVCLRSEYKHIWRAQRSLSKYLYIVSRYLTLGLTAAVFSLHFVQRPLATCDALVRLNCAALAAVQIASTAVLTQRAYILSQRSNTVLGILSFSMLTTLLLGIFHAIFAVRADPSVMIDGRGYCHAETNNGWNALSAMFFGVPIIANTFATAVIVSRARKHLSKSTSLRTILLVDGILFIIGVDAVGLVQLVVFLAAACGMLGMLNSAALLALTSVFSCRLILHIREEAASVHSQSADRAVDWSNGFGKPADHKSPQVSENSRTHLWSGNKLPSLSIVTARKASAAASEDSRHSSFYGCKSFEDLPDFDVHALTPTVAVAARPALPVRVSTEVHQRVETMSAAEVDWEKEQALRHSRSFSNVV